MFTRQRVFLVSLATWPAKSRVVVLTHAGLLRPRSPAYEPLRSCRSLSNCARSSLTLSLAASCWP